MSPPQNTSLVLITLLSSFDFACLRLGSRLSPSSRVSTLDFDFDINSVSFDYLRHLDLTPFDFNCLQLLLILSYLPPPPLCARSADSPVPSHLVDLSPGLASHHHVNDEPSFLYHVAEEVIYEGLEGGW